MCVIEFLVQNGTWRVTHFLFQMPVGDSRKAHILATIGGHFSIPANDDGLASLHDSSALNNFLDDGNVTSLAASLVKGKDRLVTLSNKVVLFFPCFYLAPCFFIWAFLCLIILPSLVRSSTQQAVRLCHTECTVVCIYNSPISTSQHHVVGGAKWNLWDCGLL